MGLLSPLAHNGGRPLESVNMAAAERERLGRAGVALIEATVNIGAVPQAVRDEPKYVHEVVIPE